MPLQYGQKKNVFLTFLSTAATESLGLTDCGLEHNGASSHTFSTARSELCRISADAPNQLRRVEEQQ